MKVHAGGDDELGELAGPVGACEDRGGEARPEGFACVAEGREGAGCGAGESVVDGGGEACPELGCLPRRGVGKGGWRGEGEDRDEFGLAVVGEVDVGGRGGVEEVGGWRGDDEDGCQARDLRGGWVSKH